MLQLALVKGQKVVLDSSQLPVSNPATGCWQEEDSKNC